MATRYWKPRQINTAQVSAGSVDSVDATPSNNTFTITIGGYAVSVAGITNQDATAAALVNACNASSHPYFSAVTWSNTTNDVTATADTAGAPFIAALTVTGAGTGTVTNFSDTTANTSPHDANDPLNWSGETKPTAGDDIIVGEGTVSILYGLESITAASSLSVLHSFTGKIGLEASAFATSADGDTFDTSVPEYRDHYFRCELATITIGRDDGLGAAYPASVSGAAPVVLGSERIKIHNDLANASYLRVLNTRTNVGTDKPAVRYLADRDDARVEVVNAPGGVGIGVDEPDETATIGPIFITGGSTDNVRVVIGAGVAVHGWEQQIGDNVLNSSADISPNDVIVHGGSLRIVGADYLIQDLTINGGTVTDDHTNSIANEWTNVIVNEGGTLVLNRVQQSGRDCANMTINPGGTVRASWDDLTVTTFNLPTVPATIAVT